MFILLFLAGAVAPSSAFMDSILSEFISSKCTEHEFACTNRHCIAKTLRCDGTNDCGDYSDEHECERHFCKEPHFFRCKNGRCIDKVFVCDKQNDCEDYSDELECESFKFQLSHLQNSTCEPDYWQCTDKLCIPEEWVCNDEVDCLDGSDEGIGCSSKIHCDGFQCKNNHCIPTEWVCDGSNDCHDNSDEIDCANHFDIRKCNMDERKFLCSNNKTCIDLQNVCNGKPDCPDKSDESKMCSLPAFGCREHGCSHECQQLPSGPKCMCPKGYHNLDEKRCVDIDECQTYGICDQKCLNTPGSYVCSCTNKYILQDDKKTCKAIGGEALMVFSSKTEIRAYMLTSQTYFSVASNLKQVVGVDYDGHHIYWTEVFAEHESIVRASEDGSNQEVVVTSGLGLPEDLAIDYLTGNIYFTDAQKKHVGVCSSDGSHCTVLVNEGIRKPRAIVLNVDDGNMYWSDWGKPAEIAYSSMDGSNYKPFVSSNIYWPNGIALDHPNGRLYWSDAKKKTLESINLDGTDRRVVLKGIVKHPYAIALFENRLFWSEWETHSVQSCDKFTGKNHRTLIKEEKDFIYGLSIFHSALRKRIENPCSLAFCSDICLLSGSWYTCACPEDKVLDDDKHTCREKERRQMLVVGAKDLLLHIEHQKLGKHTVTALPAAIKKVGCLTYNGVTDTLYVSDLGINRIVSIDMKTEVSKVLDIQGLGKVIAMDYDHVGNNLYFCDEVKASLEVVNLNTMSRKVLIHDTQEEIPQSIAVVPEHGVMFVALTNKNKEIAHIDRMYMDGTDRTHITESGLIGPISLHYDYGLHVIFFADASTSKIETVNVDGDIRHEFRSLLTTPTDITSLKSDVFWVNEHSHKLYWAEKTSLYNYNQKLKLDVPADVHRLHITSVTPTHFVPSACHVNNGNCTDLCLASHKGTVCACPVRMNLASDGHTCERKLECDSNEFLCSLSNECIPKSMRCDGHTDCHLGEDEQHCEVKNVCSSGQFACKNGQCIPDKDVCNLNFDCKDKSDEHDCEHRNANHCPIEHFRCGDGRCISDRFVCDGVKDCSDKSDERNCATSTCESSQFRCDSGACIPKSWECDLEYDCNDLSDEHTDCVFVTCPPNLFRCDNGKCIDNLFKCDGSDDCGDHSDETNCYSHFDCDIDEFSCSSNHSICLPIAANCNGTSECPQGEDEKECIQCDVREFQCNNKKCVLLQWTCDGADDCGDKSDEDPELCKEGADRRMLVHHAHAPCEHGFRCESGGCVSQDVVCNGKPDCYDGSDENGLCSNSCTTLHNPCSQLCVKTPHGPICHCKSGYRLMGDGHSCVDEDECTDNPPVCSQLCFNKVGSYHCDCYHGFLLRSDKKSCKASGDPMSFIFVADNQIRRLNQKTNSLDLLYSEEMPKITGLDISVINNNIYFIIENSDTIQRIDMTTKTRHYIERVGRPEKIALDWSTHNVYYFNAESHSKSISACSFDEMVCAKVVDIDLHRHVSELVVDPINKVMFYTLASWWVFNTPNFVIYRVNLDGSDRTEVVKSTTGYLKGLTYDFNKKEIFYVDQHQGRIMSTKYDGTMSTVLFSNLSRPAGLRFFENQLFYSAHNGFVKKCKLFGPKSCESFNVHISTEELFTVSQEGLQPDVDNPCESHNCTYMCVTGSEGFSCLCKDGTIDGSGGNCTSLRNAEDDGREVRLHSMKLAEGKQTLKQTSGGFVVAIVISLCMIALGAALICYARRKNRAVFTKYLADSVPNFILVKQADL